MQFRLLLALHGNPFLSCWFSIWQTCKGFSWNSCELRISCCIKLSKVMDMHPSGFWKGVEKSSLHSRLWWRQRIYFVLNKRYFFSQWKHIVWFRNASFWIFISYNSNMFISTLGLCLVKCKWEGMWWLYLQQQSLLRSEKLSSVLDTWCVLYLLQNLCHSDLWASPSLMCGTGSCMTMPKQLCMGSSLPKWRW